MDALPIWVVFAGTIVLVWIAIEAGYRLGDARQRGSEDEKDSPVSAISGAVLGLSAFMLAFTFGIVAERYDTKKGLVREDAGAIRTAWQRSDFLPEPDRAEAGALLVEYLDRRLSFVQAEDFDVAHVESGLLEIERIQNRLWDMAVANARKDMNSDVAALYVESLNELVAIHATRVAVGLQSRVPVEIWFVLYCITTFGMMGVGYQTGNVGSKRSKVRPFLALSFALVFALIASLDRPDSGVMKVSQQPLIDLRDAMKRSAGS